MRYDHVYVVATVGVRKNSYRLLNRKPKSLRQNEFCYGLKIETDTDAWQKRMKEVALDRVIPPEVLRITESQPGLEKSTGDQVLERLKG